MCSEEDQGRLLNTEGSGAAEPHTLDHREPPTMHARDLSSF